MKFVLALIRALGIVLSICLFCAFMYYTFIDLNEVEYGKALSYGSLLLFVLSTVITSLVSVGFENYQNKKQDSALIKRITDKLQTLSVPVGVSGGVNEPDMTLLMNMVMENNSVATEMWREGFDSIRERLNELSNANFSKKVDFGIESLSNRLTEIQEMISAKNEMPDFSEMAAFSEKLTQFNQDFENIKNQMTKSMSEISQELLMLKKQQKNYDDSLKDIVAKLDYLLPLTQNLMQKNMFSQRDFMDFEEDENDAKTEDFDNSVYVKGEENVIPSENDTTEETDVLAEENIVAENKAEVTIEEIAEQKPERIIENIMERTTETETSDEVDLNQYLSGNDIESVSLETQNGMSDNGAVLVDTPEYVAENPFGAPVTDSVSKHLPKIEAGTDPTLYGSDTPFGEENAGSTEDMPDLPPPTNPAMLESDNPYGIASENTDYEVPLENGALEADNPFGTPVESADSFDEKVKDKTQLKDIFNDKFAEEMAALDILKNDDVSLSSQSADETYEEIDLNELLGK